MEKEKALCKLIYKIVVVIFWLAPFFPVLTTRLILCMRFRVLVSQILTEDELDRDAHRNIIMPLAGFSFTGLIGLIVLENTLRLNYKYAIYCLLVSFLSYLFALNIQGYKYKRWHDQISTGLIDTGSLSLVLAICYLVWENNIFDESITLLIIACSLSAWLFDHLIRIRLQWQYLKQIGGTSNG